MAKVKIVSNPYEKKTEFWLWDRQTKQYKPIDKENNANSKLLKDEFVSSFLPFKAKDIVDEIIVQYETESENMEIVFQGSHDEYRELAELCSFEPYKNTITLIGSDTYLENARDVLPYINEVYSKKIRPLILEGIRDKEKVSKLLDKFTEIADDTIPVCVLGNYSTGKSTFINALIGTEVLPSGAEPVTAKVFKIMQPKEGTKACVSCDCGNESIKLYFDEYGYSFESVNEDNPLVQKLSAELAALHGASRAALINKVLEVINIFEDPAGVYRVSDLIEIEVPFSGLWKNTPCNFVIFDTPGSNTASNNEHIVVLQEALRGFSNGLPVFVSVFDSLDSRDNENLYQVIKDVEALDDRFTMIVVNKADVAKLVGENGLSPEVEQGILRQAVPKNLYSGGLWFVSSVMGLGAKNDGDFIDEFNAELFDGNRNKFENPSSRFYKRLYVYNIMPEQLKKKMVNAAEHVLKNPEGRLFANSGLFSVEGEIQLFAQKYSAYNKCREAKKPLEEAISITKADLEVQKADLEKKKEEASASLDDNKQKLLKCIEKKASIDHGCEYQRCMDKNFAHSYNGTGFSKEILAAREVGIRETKNKEFGLDQKKDKRKDSPSKLLAELQEKATTDLGAVAGIFSDFFSEYSKATENLRNANKDIDKAVKDELLRSVAEDFSKRYSSFNGEMYTRSVDFWNKKAALLKTKLIEIVFETQALEEDKKQELEKIILSYGDITFEPHVVDVFFEEDFTRDLVVLGYKLIDTDKVDIARLAKRYNAHMLQKLQDAKNDMQSTHTTVYTAWSDSLVELLKNNLVEYNPGLNRLNKDIKKLSDTISVKDQILMKLTHYKKRIEDEMSWKTLNKDTEE